MASPPWGIPITIRGGPGVALRNIMHRAAVERMVMKRTDHCLLGGEGALKFARAHGFPEINLLTDEALEIWLHWKETNGKDSDWIAPPNDELAPAVRAAFGIRPHGTIQWSALDTHGNLEGGTTTSGLYYEIPRRAAQAPARRPAAGPGAETAPAIAPPPRGGLPKARSPSPRRRRRGVARGGPFRGPRRSARCGPAGRARDRFPARPGQALGAGG